MARQLVELRGDRRMLQRLARGAPAAAARCLDAGDARAQTPFVQDQLEQLARPFAADRAPHRLVGTGRAEQRQGDAVGAQQIPGAVDDPRRTRLVAAQHQVEGPQGRRRAAGVRRSRIARPLAPAGDDLDDRRRAPQRPHRVAVSAADAGARLRALAAPAGRRARRAPAYG
nr:hypothetical protein [Solimonas soli]